LKFQDVNYINFTGEELDQLFLSAKNGSRSSFEELSKYVRHISYTYFLSKFRLGKISSIEDADDLTNNVILSFAEQYQKIENIEYWLRRVLFLNFVNWYKKSHTKRTFELNKAKHLEVSGPDPGDNIDVGKILSLLNNFSHEKQLIIKLRFWEDLKFSEIGKRLNKSEDAVKKLFYRTIEEIRNMI
jgi:RNA polymerase sigma-70 factor, ECF subfamily